MDLLQRASKFTTTLLQGMPTVRVAVAGCAWALANLLA